MLLKYWDDPITLKYLKEYLENNRVVITSTDTILGFLAATNESNYSHISTLKNRPKNKPFLILLNSYNKLYNLVQDNILNNNKIYRFINNIWPGPVTIIFPAKNNIPSYLKSNENTIAIRNPNHSGLQEILRYFPSLYSTSANTSNSPFPKKIEDLEETIKSKTDLAIISKKIDTQKNLYETLPSTIIKISDKIKIIREGAFPVEELERIYGYKFAR